MLVKVYDPELAAVFQGEKHKVHGWKKDEEDVSDMNYVVLEDGTVMFRADEY